MNVHLSTCDVLWLHPLEWWHIQVNLAIEHLLEGTWFGTVLIWDRTQPWSFDLHTGVISLYNSLILSHRRPTGHPLSGKTENRVWVQNGDSIQCNHACTFNCIVMMSNCYYNIFAIVYCILPIKRRACGYRRGKSVAFFSPFHQEESLWLTRRESAWSFLLILPIESRACGFLPSLVAFFLA